MNHIDAVQDCINAIEADTYLEIGIERGVSLNAIKAPRKIGVDPVNSLKWRYRMDRLLGQRTFDPYWMTSDLFFANYASHLLATGLDIAFIDGLHTYSQTLRDVENCLRCLNKNGILVVHDCSPPDSAHAYPVVESYEEIKKLVRRNLIPGWEGGWCGDVWKVIVHLRATRSDLNIFTVDDDLGLGVITWGSSELLKILTIEELKEADFSFLNSNRKNLLNLVNAEYFTNEFIPKLNSKKKAI